jgi:hypothetical protein
MVKLRKIGCTRALRHRRRADGFVAELDRDTAGQRNEPSMHSSTSSGLDLDRPFSRVAGHGCLGGNRRANGRCSARPYAMTAVVPLASLLVIGVALT